MEMEDNIKKLTEDIDRINKELMELKELKSEKIFVPKEIKLLKGGDGYSIELVNGNNQGLLYDRETKNYDVASYKSGSNNTTNNGSNYELVKVDKPEAGKLYLCTEDIFERYTLHKYGIYLDDELQVYWNEYDNYYSVGISTVTWAYYYEVRKVE